MERSLLEERMQDYSSIYSKSAIELSSNSALEPLFKYFLAVSPSSKGKSRGMSPPPNPATVPAKHNESLEIQLASPQNSSALSRKSVKPRSQAASPFTVAPAHKESASRVFEAKCIAKCQTLNAGSQSLPPGFMESAQASARMNDLSKRASQLIALENQIHEAIELIFEEAMKDLEAQFNAERIALQKIHEDESRKSYADLEKYWSVSTGFSPSIERPPSSGGHMIVRPEEMPFADAAKNEKMIGKSRMLALLLRNSSRISSLFRSHAYERSELVRRYAIEVESLCNSREKIMHRFMEDARSSLMKTKQVVDVKVTQHVGAAVHVQKPHGKNSSSGAGGGSPTAEQVSVIEDSATKNELSRLRAVLKDLREFGRKIKMEHADIKTENESLMEQLEELKTSKMTISDTISGAMASIQGGTALSSEIFDRNRSSQSLTSQAQTNQLRKQCDVLKNENLKLLNTKSQVLRDVRTLTQQVEDLRMQLLSYGVYD